MSVHGRDGDDDARVAVVVVTYNSESVIAGLVESLPDGLAGVDWSLTIVDNDSTDRTVETARRSAPCATIIETQRNGGYAAGINEGISALTTRHDAVLVLNPDVRLDAGCVAAMLPWIRGGGVGIVAPRLTDRHGALIESQRREPTILRALADTVLGATRAGRIGTLGEVVTDHRRYDVPGPIDWAEGSTLLISAECLAATGPWDERFFLYSEETEYMLRARDAGFTTVYVPTARATHLEGGSADSTALWPLLVTNRVRLYRLRHGRLRTALFWSIVTAREGSRALLGKQTSRAAVAALVSPRRMHAAPGPGWVSDHGRRRDLTGFASRVRRVAA